jgi:putative sigma-54 modulation protein
MQIEISGHGIDVTPAMREYAAEKLGRVKNHFDHMIALHVVMTLEKLNHKIEATLNASHKRFHAESLAADMYAAIDALADKLDGQVRKHKDKVTDHHRAESHARKTGT